MPEDPNSISRRRFLQTSGAGLAMLAARPVWALGATGPEPPARNRPAAPVVLRSQDLELVLDPKDGLPYEYRLLSAGSGFRGEDTGLPIYAIVCDRRAWAFRSVPLLASSVKAAKTQADFHFEAADAGKPAAGFVLRYVLSGATVLVTLEDVQEHQGYELIQVELPRLVAVTEADSGAWLAHGDSGGSLAYLNEATSGHLRSNTFWGGVLTTLPVVMIGTDKALCVQEVTAYMDETTLAVEGEKGSRCASLAASGIKNLLQGRYRVLDEFAKHGVDVSSEAMRYAFIGKISCFWHMPTPSPCPFAGKPIPLLPLIYRKSAIWGEARRNRETIDRILNMLFYNACPHLSIGSNPAPSEITDLYYLMMVPWFKLRSRNIEWFRREGERAVIGLEGDSQVELDWKNKSYKVMIEGVEVAIDSSTYCPLDRERIAFYSSAQKELSAPLPKDWNPESVTARALSREGPRGVQASVRAGTVTVSVPAREPVIVERSRKGKP